VRAVKPNLRLSRVIPLLKLIILAEARIAARIRSKEPAKAQNQDRLKLILINRYKYGAGDRVNDF